MKLLTKALEARLPRLGATENAPLQEKRIACKFFCLGTSWSWYVLEGERQPDGDTLLFGLVAGLERELGYFSLRELEGLRLVGTIPAVERNLYFGNHTIGEVLDGLPLSVRHWTCPMCGVSHDRDLNAAKVIERYVQDRLVLC